MANNKLQIDLTLNNTASSGLNKAQKDVSKFSANTKKNFVDIAAKVFLVQKAFQALGRVLAGIEIGAKLIQQREAFENLAESVGGNADNIIDKLK